MAKYTPQPCIYIILNIKNGKFYIGQTQNLHERWQNHRRELNGGHHHNEHLQRAWDKHGAKAFKFKVLEYCTIEDLDAREQHYLDQYAAKDLSYNIARDAGAPGRNASSETRQKLSEAGKRRWADLEARRKMSETLRGRPRSSEIIQKISESNRGKVRSPEARRKISEAASNPSPETRQKMSKAARNRSPISMETRQKLSEAQKRRWAREKDEINK